MTKKQESVQLTDATKQQVESLREWGFGSLTPITRVAIDRMYREEWQRRNRGQETHVQERPRD